MHIRSLKPEQQENGTWNIYGLPDWRITFTDICELLVHRRNFKFARYGDGEFNCMMGRTGHNCDYHNYYPDLGRDLILSTIVGRSDNVITGIQPLSLNQGIYFDLIEHLFNEKRHELVNADVFHNASITGRFREFMDIVLSRPEDVVFITNEDLEHIKGFDLRKTSWIKIRRRDCWLMYDDTRKRIARFDSEHNNGIFMLCASMMSEVIIRDFASSRNTFIDLGSVLDPYCGIKSRKYHHKLTL